MTTRTLSRVSLEYFDLGPRTRLEPGDQFTVNGEGGTFNFIAYIITPKGEWIDAYGGNRTKKGEYRQFRSFTPSRIKKKLKQKARSAS